MAMSIVNGGPGPQCFSNAVADYVCYGMSKVRATIADVPDSNVQQQLRLVCEFIIYNFIHKKVYCTPCFRLYVCFTFNY